jgi:hypothetical protein
VGACVGMASRPEPGLDLNVRTIRVARLRGETQLGPGPTAEVPWETARASLPFVTLRGSGPEQRLGALEDSEADDSRRTERSHGHVMRSCEGLCERGLSRVWGFGRLEKDAAVQTTQQTVFG